MKYIIKLFILFMPFTTFGQQDAVNISSLQTPLEYFLQVKQFGEFIDRFNYKTDWNGKPLSDEFRKTIPRTKYIFLLINREDPRLVDPNDSTYRVICSDFINYVENDKSPKMIKLYSGQVIAIAKVNITYLGKNFSINIELIPEVLPDRSAKWSINRVDSDFFTTNADSLSKHFIAPNSHETSFINIKKLNSSVNPIYFFSRSAATTANFLNEVTKKRVIIQNIEKVTFRIAFPGWEIAVDEFVRSSNNTGWLISDIKRL